MFDLIAQFLAEGPAAGLTLISLVLTFGFGGSPGAWTPWGDAVVHYHEAHRPGDPTRDGPQLYQSLILMDDQVLVEPDVGLRPWESRAVAEHGMRKLLGPSATNEEKRLVEGWFGTVRTVCGLEYRTVEGEVAIPEQRRLKGAYLLAENVYDHGCKEGRLLDVQRLRGTCTSWTPAMPSLRFEMRAIDVFLSPFRRSSAGAEGATRAGRAGLARVLGRVRACCFWLGRNSGRRSSSPASSASWTRGRGWQCLARPRG